MADQPDNQPKLTKLFKNQDPYESVAEASFTNMMISRVFLGAEIYYSLSIIWANQFEQQSKAYVDSLQSPDYVEPAVDASTTENPLAKDP